MRKIATIATLSVIGGMLVHLAVFSVIRIEAPLQRTPFPEQARVLYVGHPQQQAMQNVLQQAALFDSAPLFMPGRWNLASQMAGVASLKEATEIFQPFAPGLRLPGLRPQAPAFDAAASAGQPVLPGGPAFVLSRYGRAPAALPTAFSPGPTVRVQALAGRAAAPPPAPLPAPLPAGAPAAVWDPARFFLQLREGVPVGLPLLAQSSGFGEWDEVLKGFLASLDFYRALGDGYYEVTVFP